MALRNIYAAWIAVTLAGLIPIVLSCTALRFETFHGLFYDENITQIAKHRLVRVDECRRACVFTLGCRGFNMQWRETSRELGYCSLTTMVPKRVVKPKPDSSFYTWCPFGMNFSLTLSRCYATVKQRKSWEDSQDYCRTLHQQAHLMEIYDLTQDRVFQNMTNELLECRFTRISTEYMGHLDKTISGYTCQNWSAQSPHKHDMLKKSRAWMLEENYCRNAEGSHDTWCYTTDKNKRFDYCEVPNCADVLEPNPKDPNHPSIGLWLGARRSDRTSDVIWISSSLPVRDMEYTNFEHGELESGSTGADCMKSFRGQWSMADCSEVKAFVCEY